MFLPFCDYFIPLPYRGKQNENYSQQRDGVHYLRLNDGGFWTATPFGFDIKMLHVATLLTHHPLRAIGSDIGDKLLARQSRFNLVS